MQKLGLTDALYPQAEGEGASLNPRCLPEVFALPTEHAVLRRNRLVLENLEPFGWIPAPAL